MVHHQHPQRHNGQQGPAGYGGASKQHQHFNPNYKPHHPQHGQPESKQLHTPGTKHPLHPSKHALSGPSSSATAAPRSHPAAVAASPHAPTAEQQRLPVYEARNAIVSMVTKHPACIIVGETGSGKTTQIPQFVWDDIVAMNKCGGSSGMVGCTQPRRVAAVSIAKHVAEQRGGRVGGEVGYAVRFDDCTSHNTRLKFMTDGILLRELQTDPMLTKYSCLILDEAHERTLHGDVLFGLLKDLTRRRQTDLKIVVMSATLNATQFSKFWRDAPIGVVHGRSYPVTIYHTQEPQADFVEAAISTILQIHMEEPLKETSQDGGDILCFLTGQDEIEDAKRVLEHRLKQLPTDCPDFVVLPLYSAMPYEQQLKVFEPAPRGVRKVILATNIAETSITVEGIKFVVDCGVVKAKSFNYRTGMESLAETDVSQAQATQRTGRAGRMSAGKCYRLYTQDAFDRMLENTVPEITRCSLNSVVLQMKGIGVSDIQNFEFMDKPSLASIRRAEDTLRLLGALDTQLDITPLGKALTLFPIEPSAAKAILCGKALGVEKDVVAIVSMIATENIFITSREGKERADKCRATFAKSVGDHASHLHMFQFYMRLPQQQRGSFCEANSLSHRQLLKMEDTFKQLFGILDDVAVDPSWFHGIADALGVASSSGNKKRLRDDAQDDDGFVALPNHSKSHGGGGDLELVRRALCHGYFLNAAFFDAKLQQYRTLIGQQVVHLHPTSVLAFHVRKKPSLVLFNNVVETTQRFMKEVSAVQEQWLHDASPLLFKRAV